MHTGHATSREGWTYRNLYIEPALMTKLLDSMDWKGPTDVSFKMPLVRDTILAGRLAKVFASLGESNSLLQNEALLLSVMARLVTDHFLPSHPVADVGREHAAVVKVKDWLDAHPEQNVSVHSLATLAGLSPYYLVRVFHKQVGIPPHKYQMTVRINRARKLLISGESIPQVASRSGFCDQSHLNRCFKRTLGTTPWEYARPVRRGSDRLVESRPAENLHRRASNDD
jgi:AraC-like DNA-binding protein